MKSCRFPRFLTLVLLAFVTFGFVGVPKTWAADNPTEIRFIVSHADCSSGMSSTFEFFVSGVSVGVYSSTQSCVCNNSPLVVTLNDPATLSLIGRVGCTPVSMTLNDPTSNLALGYVRVEIDRTESGTETFCLVDYATGGTCGDRNLCDGLQWPGTSSYSNILNCAGPLEITPTNGLSSSSYEGGPFLPDSKNYTLTNTGLNSLDWTAEASVPWLDVAPNSGTLEPSQSTVVSVSINANANGLAVGNYDAAITFTNLTDSANRVQPVALTVRDIPPDGFGQYTTGGADGNVVTVTTAADLATYVGIINTPYIIQVSGIIDLAPVGGEVKIKSNKTIRGIGISPTIIGNLRFVNDSNNIIIERLNITNPSGYSQRDGITLKEDITNVFITKCTFYDCYDGCIDITRRSDWVTVSWCKFYYTTDNLNWNIIKISGDDDNTDDLGKLHVTFHHNWWSTLRNKGGMPRVYFGRVHLYNNYYNCPDSRSTHIGAGRESQVLIENNYFEDVNYPYYSWYYDEDPDTIGMIDASGNIFYNCVWWDDGDDDVFTPSYSYALDNGNDVKAIVMAGAGAPACYGDFDRNESVDFNDLALFIEYWLETNYADEVDYDDDGIVNFLDFAMLAQNWGRTDFTAPLAPNGLAATAGNAKVLLNWNNNTEDDLAGYNIYRSTTSGGGYTKVNTSLQTSSDYNDTGVTNDTTYYYVVTAVDTSSNESGYSIQVSATPSSVIPPAAPRGLFATSGNAKVLLDWINNTEGDLLGYNIYRSETSGSGYTKINTSLRTSSDYNDTGVTNGTIYYYVVTAVNTALNESGYSNQASATPSATPTAPQNLMVPPMAYDDTQIILIWSKPVNYSQVTDYNVYQNGTALGLSGRFDTTRPKLYYIVTGLTANTTYDFTVKSVISGTGESEASNTCPVTTANTPDIFYPEEGYGAAADGETKDTVAIQAAINACTPGGKVHLRAGKTFLSGAIFLKSNMTLQIDGTLLGSSDPADYPYTSLRFPYYASGNNYMGLVNAYYDYTNPASAGKPYGTITNVRICGSGVINGCEGYSASDPHTVTDLTTLGTDEVDLHGDTSRGDLVTIKGINQVYVGGWGGSLTLVYPAEHTIFISYCNDVTVSDVNCDTWDIHNGDGVNLCTSDTAYIFNSRFDTGDDCINMNAGQGQPGVDDGYPDQNIRVFNCTTQRGHGGYVIGSFTAAWVQDSLIEDCVFSTTDGIGIRMKTGYNNGGGGRRITCRDITIRDVAHEGIFLDTHYNADGYPSAGPGQFSGNIFKNININATGDSIFIYGLSGTPHTQNIFESITGNNRAYLRFCTDSTFINVNVPSWTVDANNCSGNTSSGCPGCPFIPPGADSIIIQEYDIGFCSVQGTISNTYAGYTGSGYCKASVASPNGKGIDWKISVPSSGTYTFGWRYALDSGDDRTCKLKVNNVTVVPSISFPATGAWTNWNEVSVDVSLTEGANNIRLEATTDNGFANIDYLKVIGDDPQPANCP